MTIEQPDQSSRDTSFAQAMRSAGALSAVGLAFVLAVFIGAAFGYLLDRWLGTAPWLFLLFFFLGLAAGIVNVFRITARFWR